MRTLSCGGRAGYYILERHRWIGLFDSTSFFNDTATTEIYTLSLHDALPISRQKWHAVACVPSARSAGSSSAHRARAWGDRKSTRLNSSHVRISYAVFCL